MKADEEPTQSLFRQHFDAPFQADDVPTTASDDSGRDDGSTEGSDYGRATSI